MRVTKEGSSILVLLMLCACVERYYPEEDKSLTGTLVINAALTNIAGNQTIQISRSDGLLSPEFIAESSCVVELENLDGDIISFSESTPGYYSGIIPEGYMEYGDQYMLRVITSDGNIYISDYSQLNAPTSIDRIYYELETIPGDDPELSTEGIRFYIDFQVDADLSEYMRWELVETYEFHNPDYEGFIYSFDRVLRPLPDSLDDRQCWISGHVNAIFTLDATNISDPSYTHMPLHFVSNETQRLSYGYSLLVRQHSQDQASFWYWDELKKNSYEQSGLYDRLPSLTPSNISNADDPDERILGFFGVSGVTEERFFVSEVQGLKKYDVKFCYPSPERPRFRFLSLSDLPVYVSNAYDPETGNAHSGQTVLECLDCRVRKGSSGEAPDFWPLD